MPDKTTPANGLSHLLRYGIEAPYVPTGFAAGGAAGLLIGGVRGRLWLSVVGGVMLAQAGLFLHTTVRGKILVWDDELDRLSLRGDERLLDLGCGRGAVLIAAAARLPAGRAVGVDLWRSQDQSGNDIAVTRANAENAGVADRVEPHTAAGAPPRGPPGDRRFPAHCELPHTPRPRRHQPSPGVPLLVRRPVGRDHHGHHDQG